MSSRTASPSRMASGSTKNEPAELLLDNPTPTPGGIQELAGIHGEAVVLRSGKHARDDLLTRQRAIAQGQDRGGTFVELHNSSGPGQKVAVSGGVLLQLTPRSEPNPARPGQRFVLHSLARAKSGPENGRSGAQPPWASGMAWRFILRYRVLRLMPSWAATRVMFP